MIVTPRSIEVTWSPSSSSGVTGYLISYTTNASYTSGGNVTVAGVDSANYTITDLEENTLYTITMQVTAGGNKVSANSNEVSVRTYADGK